MAVGLAGGRGRLVLTGARPSATWGLLRLRSDSRLLSDVPIRRVAARRAAGPVSREAPLARTSWFRGGSAFLPQGSWAWRRWDSRGMAAVWALTRPSRRPPRAFRAWRSSRGHMFQGPGASAFSAAADAQGLRGPNAKVGFRLRSGRVCSSSSPVTYPRPGVKAVMRMQEHPLDAGRKAGRAVAEDRRRRGASTSACAGLPPEKMRAVLAENGVTPSQSVPFLRGFWHGVTTG
jgi:hypothetical protein